VIRLTWIQFRVQAVVALGGLVIVAIALAITGPHLVHLYNTSVATCAAHGDCSTARTAFLRNDSSLRTLLGVAVTVVPGIVGIFWGAPLVAREIEDGTFRVAWTQSVTRTRWLAVKLGVIGLVSMAVAGLLSLMVTWWASPLDRAHMDVFATFDQRDIAAIGYAAFAFALGVAAGVLIRRTLPAMASTMVVFVAARLVMSRSVRPHLFAPEHRSFPVMPTLNSASIVGVGPGSAGPNTLQLGSPNLPNAWITSAQLVDSSGHAITARFMGGACPNLGAGPSAGGGAPGGLSLGSHTSHTEVPVAAQNALQDCITKVAAKFHEVVTYQPASRYWDFQWYELAIFLGAAVILSGVCIWAVRRRLT
jgi:hypothetical protein